MVRAHGVHGRLRRERRSSAKTRPGPPPYDTCTTDKDCAWGEIDHEIVAAKDCVCLYGCPYVALSKTTVARRDAQYDSLCDPTRDGQGDACGIDDCAIPNTITCNDGVCGAKPNE